MNRFRFISTAISLFIAFGAGAQYKVPYSSLLESPTSQSMRETVEYLCCTDLDGRAPGSDGEKEAAAYFGERLSGDGLDVISPKGGDVFGIVSDGDTLVSRNVVAYIPGFDKNLKDRFIVIGARLDNLGSYDMTVDGELRRVWYPGANGNASGAAVLVELARQIQTNAVLCRRSVIIVGFGASTSNFAGAWYFLNRSLGKEMHIDAMVNLDMVGREGEEFYAYTASNEDLNTVLGEINSTLQPIYPRIVSGEPYPSDHRAFYAAEIPSVFLTSGRYPEHNQTKDTEEILDFGKMEKVLEYTYNLVLTLVNKEEAPMFRKDADAVSRKSSAKGQDDVYAFTEVDYKPLFLGSPDPASFLENWVYKYVKYPREALENGTHGTVYVNFIIEPGGEVTSVEVVKGVSAALDAEAVKVVAASPKWKPAYVNGRKVRCALTVGVEFRIAKGAGFGINGKVIRKKK